MFKVGDKIRLIGTNREDEYYKECIGKIFTVKSVNSSFVETEENKDITPYFENIELVRKYTYEDLKKAPIGTKITFENGKVLIKDRPNFYESPNTYRYNGDLENLKDNNGAYGKIIKIEEPTYKVVYDIETEILNNTEKRYLKNIIRPFRYKVEYITKTVNVTGEYEHINIIFKRDTGLVFPNFEKDTMYKGMEIGKQYTLAELGI